jgi:hypothetical protein
MPLRRALARRVRLTLADIAQPVSSVVVIELVDGEEVHRIAVDIHDLSSFRDDRAAHSATERCLAWPSGHA